MTIDEITHRAGCLPASNIAVEVNETLAEHDCVVITAPPGAGKSTLLPLTILAGLGGIMGSEHDCDRIIMLEPRRLAARQIAERMADMLGERVGQTVGYRVRFENKVSVSTKVEVVTEGILARMLVSDPTLENVSVVIFDEFHERSISSDLALALTRQCHEILRPDLKIVIMSATIDATAICDALHAPLVESAGRMYPVDVCHSDETLEVQDIAVKVAAAVSRAHREHEGDVLAFLPGQGDIMQCAHLLGDSLSPTVVYPLYGNLSAEHQRCAIASSREGGRKVVLATPIAETSITIEGVRLVVDSGYCRKLVYDSRTGMSHLDTVRISNDMASQRAGRAGRTAPGTCYRLWTKSSEHRMDEHRTPEILEADLAPLVLCVAAFGENDPLNLPWLTPPPSAALAHAKNLLKLLGAIDDDGRITPLGKSMSQMPCHPRISRMMIGADTVSLKCLACDVAAVLEEKDPLSQQTEQGADLSIRLSALRAARCRQYQGKWMRIVQIAREYYRMMRLQEDDSDVCPEDIGRLVAIAYPERVAKSVDGIGCYRLASGLTVKLHKDDTLMPYPWLSIASLNASDKGGRVFLAAPLREDDIATRQRDNISWDSKDGSVIMKRERVIGSLVVDSVPLHNADKNAVLSVICEAAQKDGLSMFDWNESVSRLQMRVAMVSAWHPELSLPDISADHVLSVASSWLPFYLEQGGRIRTTISEFKKIDMAEVLWTLIPYDKQQEVDRLAPSHIVVPSGSKIRVDYRHGASAPVLSVRLQECFGMERTPCVDGGRLPVLMELLSPGFKPVQLTRDLSSFWRDAYYDVRKELRRRYPKHYWPENPMEAEAVKGVKR